jgi:hypothetical protein
MPAERSAVGAEDPRTILAHIIRTSELTIDHAAPGFSKKFLSPDKIDAIYRKHYANVHKTFVEQLSPMSELLK